MQITQEVFMAEEWVKDAWNDVKNEVHLRLDTEKALGATNEENEELLSKLIAEERERKSVEARLKNGQTQVKDQCKLFYQTEIELATSRQLVMDLKADLQKAKEAAQFVKEAAGGWKASVLPPRPKGDTSQAHWGASWGMQGLLQCNMGWGP